MLRSNSASHPEDDPVLPRRTRRFLPGREPNKRITTAIPRIDDMLTRTALPSTVEDTDAGQSSDAEVAETPTRCGWAPAARSRRAPGGAPGQDAGTRMRYQSALWPLTRFQTSTAKADLARPPPRHHRNHLADLIDGPRPDRRRRLARRHRADRRRAGPRAPRGLGAAPRRQTRAGPRLRRRACPGGAGRRGPPRGDGRRLLHDPADLPRLIEAARAGADVRAGLALRARWRRRRVAAAPPRAVAARQRVRAPAARPARARPDGWLQVLHGRGAAGDRPVIDRRRGLRVPDRDHAPRRAARPARGGGVGSAHARDDRRRQRLRA